MVHTLGEHKGTQAVSSEEKAVLPHAEWITIRSIETATTCAGWWERESTNRDYENWQRGTGAVATICDERNLDDVTDEIEWDQHSYEDMRVGRKRYDGWGDRLPEIEGSR